MKYDVTYACGHTGDVTLYGPTKERNRRIAWLEQQICPKCKDEQSAAFEGENDLPTLEGSERQVSWARKIRAELFQELDKWREEEAIRFARDPEHFMNEEQAEKCYSDAYQYFAQQESASYWIDNRDRSPVWDYIDKWKSGKPMPTVQEIREEADRIFAAQREATVKPENQTTDTRAEIRYINELEIVCVATFIKDENIVDIVKADGYQWDGSKWWLKICGPTGTAEDRMADIGNKLLNAGVPITIYDDKIRQMAVDGNFQPRKYRWITHADATHVWFWWKGSDLKIGDALRNLHSNKYYYGRMQVATRFFAEIRDIADIHGFSITEKADAILRAAEEADALTAKVNPAKVAEVVETSKDILNSSRDVLKDLKEE